MGEGRPSEAARAEDPLEPLVGAFAVAVDGRDDSWGARMGD